MAKNTKKTAKKTTAKKPAGKPATKKPAQKKPSAKKPATKKTTKPTAKKPTSKRTTKATPKRTSKPTPKKPSARKTTGKVAKAESLRQQSVKDMNKLSRIPTAWSNKLKTCKNSTERKKVDDTYQRKFNQAEKVERASYKAYYDYVSKNFTIEEQKTAMAKSKNFMSKKFTNALKGKNSGK